MDTKEAKNNNPLNESGELIFKSYVTCDKHFEDSKIVITLSNN